MVWQSVMPCPVSLAPGNPPTGDPPHSVVEAVCYVQVAVPVDSQRGRLVEACQQGGAAIAHEPYRRQGIIVGEYVASVAHHGVDVGLIEHLPNLRGWPMDWAELIKNRKSSFM